MQIQVYTTGNPYGIAEDLVFSMPCRSKVSFLSLQFLFSFSSVYLFIWIFHGPTPKKIIPNWQGDGDYELVKDVVFDDYLLKKISKVCF